MYYEIRGVRQVGCGSARLEDAGFRPQGHLGTTKVVMRKVIRPKLGGLPRVPREGGKKRS